MSLAPSQMPSMNGEMFVGPTETMVWSNSDAQRLARRVVCVEVDARLDGVHPLNHGVVVHVALAHLDVSCPKRRPGELETFRWAEVGVVAGHVVVELCLEEAESLETHGRCGVKAHVRVNHELVGRRVAVRHLEV